jgi:hypothetical protein
MDKDTLKTIKLIKEAKGGIDYILNRLVAEIEGIYAEPITFEAPKAIIEPSGELPPPF